MVTHYCQVRGVIGKSLMNANKLKEKIASFPAITIPPLCCVRDNLYRDICGILP